MPPNLLSSSEHTRANIARQYFTPDVELSKEDLQSLQSSPTKIQKITPSISFSPVTEGNLTPLELYDSHSKYQPESLRKKKPIPIPPSFPHYNPFLGLGKTPESSSGYSADASSIASSPTPPHAEKQKDTNEPFQQNLAEVFNKKNLRLAFEPLKKDTFSSTSKYVEPPRVPRHLEEDLFSKYQ